MSQLLINAYLADLHRLQQVSGSKRESVIREAFKDLLKAWGKSLDLQFIPEHEYTTVANERRYIDGALLYDLRVPFGYWEAKDTKDKLDAEIAKKFSRGYPQNNIIFEDSVTAVLFQNGKEILRSPVDDVAALQKLLALFFSYQRPEIDGFRKAIVQFALDLPDVLKTLRSRIDEAYDGNQPFAKSARNFLKHAQETINPSIADADVREMLIQHILTEDIFARIFGQSDFHQENNVAKALYDLEKLFFRGAVKQETLKKLDTYYAAIRSTAALIRSHSEKQGFLKAIYGNFYKVYNPKAADRLGVVYTPTEIVRFMIEGADWLCDRHFGKRLVDKNVDILDPATGTGTFIVELLEHFRGRPANLKFKYKHELHANEVAILPYYVANLNIEATYAALTEQYGEFPNLCFVDTLDNTAALVSQVGHQPDLLGGISTENVDRIQRQNKRKISVIIGNPPYNANQQNENDNNKNREYPDIDKRIQNTYVEHSTATRTNVYDMYSRFFRWAADRIAVDGIVAFVTNRGFLDQRSFDGFRKTVAGEFNEIRIVDLGGDVRVNPKLSGTNNNVFGIQTGVAISFMVKKMGATGCRIYYARRPEYDTASDKLEFLQNTKIDKVEFEEIKSDRRNNWITFEDTGFDTLIPLISKETKQARNAEDENAIFRSFSLGVVTARDDWVYGRGDSEVRRRVKYLIAAYNREVAIAKGVAKLKRRVTPANSIKWSRLTKTLLTRGVKLSFSETLLADCTYRPFARRRLYFSKQLNEVQYRLPEMFGPTGALKIETIVWSDPTSQKLFMCLATNGLYDYHLVGAAASAMGAARRVTGPSGEVDNITDWALMQFTRHYGLEVPITKDDIFAYVYAVLHDPAYRKSYALNLKQDNPRLPLYDNFPKWVAWGRKLLKLHIDYETADEFKLARVETPNKAVRRTGQTPRLILSTDRAAGTITLDAETKLTGVPASAWTFMLGNRCAIDWVIDQHKEKNSKDLVIRRQFKAYRFADHKAEVIELLQRVITVSVNTVAILDEMRPPPKATQDAVAEADPPPAFPKNKIKAAAKTKPKPKAAPTKVNKKKS